jgi:polysaccharide export outer membrane protein
MKFISGRFAFLSMIILTQLLASCGTAYKAKRINKEHNYFQTGLDSVGTVMFKPLTIQPNDLISIQVTSNTMNQEQVAIFMMGNNGGITQGSSNQALAPSVMGYLVDEKGFINLPLLGRVYAVGKTRAELGDYIKNALESQQLVKAPNVQVRFLQFRVTLLGEVKIPGTKSFATDRVTILDAIGAAGDLTDRGRRDNVKIIRDEQGTQKVLSVNLLNGDFMKNESYQLRQNDIIYVYANDIKLKETKFDPNSRFMRDLQIGSFLMSIFFIVTNILILLKN